MTLVLISTRPLLLITTASSFSSYQVKQSPLVFNFNYWYSTGLGRRKADAFLKDYRRQNIRIEHRQKILGVNDDQVRSIGPTVFVNCVGFIRLNTSELGDAEEYVDVFDSTRIHPESFEYGRKMCKDLACQVEVDMDEDECENEEYRAVNKVIT